jgi:hypothetical protein
MKIESNLFPIKNLADFTGSYVLYEIVGLKETDEDYDINVEFIIKKLSYSLKHPVTVILNENKPHLVVRNDEKILTNMPSELGLRRNGIVYFRKGGKSFNLDFLRYNEQTKKIILRFLQFDISTALNNDSRLWQPSAGEAFFSITPSYKSGQISVYNGFDLRVVEMPSGGFGVAIDITKKYIDSNPLDVYFTQLDFRKLANSRSHLMYQYGNKRYEIKVKEHSDLNITQVKFPQKSDGKMITLLQDVQEKFGTSMPPEVAHLPDDASVLIYETNDGQERSVPAGLCFKVYDTEDPLVQKLHRKSILEPFHRRRLIRIVYQNYLRYLKFGSIKINIDSQPIALNREKFLPPDVRFGQDLILSVRQTASAIQTTIEDLGKTRKELLDREKAGFYTNAEFEPQYFVVPMTTYRMYANENYFLQDLEYQVNRMHTSEANWKPEVIEFDNRNKKNPADIGFSILKAMEEKLGRKRGGYALVMLPTGVEKSKGRHDELAALVVSQCFENFGITASIMHSQTLDQCYAYKSANGEAKYYVKHNEKGLYKGYVKNVALNQVLLNNERWPFVLETPMHADFTIGIDVKRNVAGFTFVDKLSRHILTKYDKSTNREKLSKSQVFKMLMKYFPIQLKYAHHEVKNIVFHRDGRLYQQEKEGIRDAIKVLIEKGLLKHDVTISFVEIPKYPMAPFRVFDVRQDYNILKQNFDNGLVLNPESGTWVAINDREAYLCTTGREYYHQGTSRPLYVKADCAGLTLSDILEDIYFLSCLTYTKPDDCSRNPLTIKITDTRINTLGSEFDFDALDILMSTHF